MSIMHRRKHSGKGGDARPTIHFSFPTANPSRCAATGGPSHQVVNGLGEPRGEITGRDTGQFGDWLHDDQTYFDSHPEARWRVRKRSPQEFQPQSHTSQHEGGTSSMCEQFEAILSQNNMPEGAVVGTLVVLLQSGQRARVPVIRLPQEGDRIYWPDERGVLREIEPESVARMLDPSRVIDQRLGDACPECQRAYVTGDVALMLDNGEVCFECFHSKRRRGAMVKATSIYVALSDGNESTWPPGVRERFQRAQSIVAAIQRASSKGGGR